MSAPSLTATRLGPLPDESDRRPLLVLGSSLGTSHLLWSWVAPALLDSYEVVAVDLPGHGSSAPATTAFSVADLAAATLAAVDGLGDPGRRFVYAGVSLGGAVGLQLLLDAPDRVSAATLLCTGARLGTAEDWAERASTVRTSGTGSVVDLSRGRWFGDGFADRCPGVAGALLDELPTIDDESYARCCEALAGFDVRDQLGEIDAPVLVISGTDDVTAPPEVGATIADGVCRGRQLVLDGVGHLAPAEAPTRVAVELIRAVADDFEAGMAVRRAVLGDAHVDRATTAIDGTTRDFQELITRYAWGGIWTRPGLDRRTRSLITITALVAGHHWNELELHLRAAVVSNGVSREEVVEVLLQSAIYCSVPSANTAFGIAQKLFDALGEEQS